MSRAHKLQCSREICFVDSTSACDPEQHSITFVMTPCAAGAVPLGIIITKGQTSESYCAGFQLLLDIVSNSFHPKIFLTDNSEAEILALNKIFPNSLTLLCIFHVLQAVWRWLWDSKHGIPKEDRQNLMHSFRKILYSRTYQDAEKAFYDISSTKYENWVKYVEGYWQFKEKWCLAWRSEDSKGHYTNNFCEVSIRLFKDNILCRVKAYNVIALIDTISLVLEKFYKSKLREFSNSRSSQARLHLLSMTEKTKYLQKDDIISLNDFTFKVPSETCKNMYHFVDLESGLCSCFQGSEGKFCKHQCAIYRLFDIKTKYFPPVTTEDRYIIAKLALGDEAPNISFYEPFVLKSVSDNLSRDSLNKFHKEDSIVANNTPELFNVDHFKPLANDNKDSNIEEICNLIKEHHSSFGSSFNGLKILKDRLKKIKSEGQWENFIHTAGNCVPLRVKRNATIRVQPTAISRRTPGVTKGAKRLPSGRRFKTEMTTRKKRQRNLRLNIEQNRPNAISHGHNH